MNIRTDNDFLIGTNGATIVPMLPVNITSKEQAYRTAAWIAVMGFTLPLEDDANNAIEFEDVYEGIMNT